MTPPLTYPVTAGDINIYHARLIADQQITYVLDCAGRLDAERLNGSLAALRRAVPILGSRLRVEGSRFWRASADEPTCVTTEAAVEPAQAVERFVAAPCDPLSELPLKVQLARGEGGDTLCVKVDHVLTDAAGLKSLLYLLAEAYSAGEIRQPVNLDRGFGQVIGRFSPLELASAALRPSLPKPGAPIAAGPFEAEPTFLEHVTLEPEQFERLHARLRTAGATINDAVLAGLYRVVFERIAAAASVPYPLMVPVDMRRTLPEDRQCVIANLSSAVYPALNAVPGETFGGTLARVSSAMNGFKDRQPGLSAMLLMSLGALGGGSQMRRRYEMASRRGSRFISATNFGVIDSGRIGFDGADVRGAYGIGPIQYAPGILIALSSYGGRLHFVVQSNDRQTFQPVVRDFLGGLVAQLETFVQAAC